MFRQLALDIAQLQILIRRHRAIEQTHRMLAVLGLRAIVVAHGEVFGRIGGAVEGANVQGFVFLFVAIQGAGGFFLVFFEGAVDVALFLGEALGVQAKESAHFLVLVLFERAVDGLALLIFLVFFK